MVILKCFCQLPSIFFTTYRNFNALSIGDGCLIHRKNHFRRLPGRWKSNGWDRRCFLFIQIAWWIYPGGRVLHRPWSRQNVERDLGDNLRCLEPIKARFFTDVDGSEFQVFFLHHSICSEKNSHHYLTICGFVWYIAGGHRWIPELSTLKSWERYQWNIQLSRFWTLRVLYSLSTERNRILKTNLRWTKCWEFLQITGCSSKHRRGHWNTIHPHPRYMWFWPPRKNVVFDDVSKHLVRFF